MWWSSIPGHFFRFPLFLHGDFVFGGRHVAGRRMQPLLVVERQDVISDIRLCFEIAPVRTQPDPLGLQSAEETFYYRVIPAVALTTHALRDPVLAEEVSEHMAGVLTALIRME